VPRKWNASAARASRNQPARRAESRRTVVEREEQAEAGRARRRAEHTAEHTAERNEQEPTR